MSSDEGRKIELPGFCCPGTGRSWGGDENCEHDYSPESQYERFDVYWWVCSKCGMRRGYEVYD